MPDPPDRVAAIVQYLKNDTSVAAKVTRSRGSNAGTAMVFADELPDFIVPQMPIACILIEEAPGAPSIHPRSYMEHSDSHIQIKHYAWTISSARTLASVVTASLKQLGRNHDGVVNNTYIHWANKTSGPIPMRDFAKPAHTGEPVDREHYWPLCITSWHVYAADIPVT